MNHIQQLIRSLNTQQNSPTAQLLQHGWSESARTLPHRWELLEPQCVFDNRQWCGCEDSCDETLQNAAITIKNSPDLYQLAWHCHRLIFEEKDYGQFREWDQLIPVLDEVEPGFSGVFFLFLALGAAPRLRQQNQKQGISDNITKATLFDIGIVQRRFAHYSNNAIGVEPHLLRWHRLVASGDLHRVGRFEYVARPFGGRLRAFRHQQTGQVCALSIADVEYDEFGLIPYKGQKPQWKSTLIEDAQKITGQIVSPRGFVRRDTVSLELEEWQEVLSHGDTVLEMHIPEGNALTQEVCLDSLRQGKYFFERHYPKLQVHSFACYSWLFNIQWQQWLGEKSRLVGWQREVHLFPTPSNGNDGLYFIFNKFEIDPNNAPTDTRLRRIVVDHLKSGGKLRGGGMFFLFEDLEDYGTQVYWRRGNG